MFTLILTSMAAMAYAQVPIITLNPNVLLPLSSTPSVVVPSSSVALPIFTNTGAPTTITLPLNASPPTQVASILPISVPAAVISPITSTITQTICAVCSSTPVASILPVVVVPATLARNSTPTSGYTGPIRSGGSNSTLVQASGAGNFGAGTFAFSAGLLAASCFTLLL
ncbi:hypothetical protein BCR37DRAFT_377037 [Protomyces lactucae-debilis]|uniref:Uncharacterized protein n=1 Tax=Protomyces lactucae-debilis TaxID=2754530 RepID=A0A1Y2FUN7_PROLT|nr:uncharacterized protein BCR37DRAFT_377037 [Protomyces lactucae-debilis]ORY86415.1 hypothetical protein BCR37DRAFT_377037 [Protomyces lactucae-debilis]